MFVRHTCYLSSCLFLHQKVLILSVASRVHDVLGMKIQRRSLQSWKRSVFVEKARETPITPSSLTDRLDGSMPAPHGGCGALRASELTRTGFEAFPRLSSCARTLSSSLRSSLVQVIQQLCVSSFFPMQDRVVGCCSRSYLHVYTESLMPILFGFLTFSYVIIVIIYIYILNIIN